MFTLYKCQLRPKRGLAHLKLQCTLGADDDVLVETLLGVVWQLKC